MLAGLAYLSVINSPPPTHSLAFLSPFVQQSSVAYHPTYDVPGGESHPPMFAERSFLLVGKSFDEAIALAKTSLTAKRGWEIDTCPPDEAVQRITVFWGSTPRDGYKQVVILEIAPHSTHAARELPYPLPAHAIVVEASEQLSDAQVRAIRKQSPGHDPFAPPTDDDPHSQDFF